MRPVARMALAAATTLAVTLPIGGAALADTPTSTPTPIPTKAQVDQAQAKVNSKKLSVKQIEAALTAANARMDAASNAAEVAFERYNGAQWRLQQAKKASRQAKAASLQAAHDVTIQRAGIVQLVTQSYQNGTELGTASALLSSEGPTGLMNRYAVVQSAGDSMQARYDRFRVASARAKTLAAKAADAEKHQAAMATEAKKLATAAGDAAAAAASAANQVEAQKKQLLEDLAKAEHISVSLATERHDALVRIASEKAAAAKAALEKKQAEAKKAAEKANEASGGSASSGGGGGGPVVADPAPNQSVAVQRAISYAKAQLGKPYQWGAQGPSTFDCSGLTMRAWGAGGKSLPHYSVAQYEESTPISMSDARPGDLIFWSSNGSPSGIHHVALYLGGGQFIEAPHTGADVRYNSIYNEYPDFVARP